MSDVEVGEIVTLTEIDSEPVLLVLEVDEYLTGTLLADLPTETIQRLETTVGDPEGRRTVAQAVANTEDITTFAVPPQEVDPRDELGIQSGPPSQRGAE